MYRDVTELLRVVDTARAIVDDLHEAVVKVRAQRRAVVADDATAVRVLCKLGSQLDHAVDQVRRSHGIELDGRCDLSVATRAVPVPVEEIPANWGDLDDAERDSVVEALLTEIGSLARFPGLRERRGDVVDGP